MSKISDLDLTSMLAAIEEGAMLFSAGRVWRVGCFGTFPVEHDVLALIDEGLVDLDDTRVFLTTEGVARLAALRSV